MCFEEMNRYLIKNSRNFQRLIFMNKNEFLINLNIQKRLQSNDFKVIEIDRSMVNEFGDKTSWISDSPITHFVEQMITNMHDFTGVSWTFNIILSALMLRLFICFPLRIHNEVIRARQENLRPAIKRKVEEQLDKAGFRTVQKMEAKNKLLRRVVYIFDIISIYTHSRLSFRCTCSYLLKFFYLFFYS